MLLLLLFGLALASSSVEAARTRGDIPFQQESRREPSRRRPRQQPPSPYVLFGPHGYSTFQHSRCQDVPTAEVDLAEIEGDWNLVEYMTSFDGKPFPPHSPYLCPESKVVVSPAEVGKKGLMRVNFTQVSFEWPLVFKDVVEWQQHKDKSGVFFHEENIFALWTMKIMEVRPDDYLHFFFCIDYTVWPGWNHRGVFILSREPELKSKIRRKLSPAAHRRLRIEYHRTVNTTTCDRDSFLDRGVERFHPHRAAMKESVRAPISPVVSRKHRRNLDVLD